MSNVTHPAHYNSGKIEVIEAIEDWGLGFHLGNTLKYVARAGKKDPSKEVEDLQKAQWYLARKIELLMAKKDDRAVIRPNDMNPRPDMKGFMMAVNMLLDEPAEVNSGISSHQQQIAGRWLLSRAPK